MKPSNPTTLILRIFITVLLGWAGFQKVSGAQESIAVFARIGMEPLGRYLIGILELAAAFLILFPSSLIAGAILTWGLMAGAVLAHLTRLGVSGPSAPLFVAALLTLFSASLLIYQNRSNAGFLNKMFSKEP